MSATLPAFTRFFADFGIAGFKPQIRCKNLSMGILTVLGCLVGLAKADQFGDFTYVDTGTAITITGYPTGAEGVVVIPSTIAGKPVTSIGSSAFQSCNSLTRVEIPDGVTSIGNNAFFNCAGMTSVSIPPSVTTIGDGAFYLCSSLSGVAIAGVTSLGVSAFYNCHALTTVDIPPGLTSIPPFAFGSCVGLKNMMIPTWVTSIGYQAFSNCTSLQSVTIPSSVTSIGDAAFLRCLKLESVTIPSGITSLPTALFYQCSSLTSVNILSSATSIGVDTFRFCSSLQSIAIPPTVTSIGNNAFNGCTGLSTVQISSAVTNIGVGAFVSCGGLTAIQVDAANPNYSSVGGVLCDKTQTQLITCPAGIAGNFSVPAGATTIGVVAFLNCAKLTEVTFPAGVASLGNQAFSGCSLLTKANFNGDAPEMGFSVFSPAGPGFAVYFSGTSNGFTSPEWFGYPAYIMGGGPDPIATWLISKGLPADSDMKSDSNGDGVSLLMAYALNLDPNQSLGGSLPQPAFTVDQMILSFYAGASGVSYVVESSTDMANWSALGVVISPPDQNQVRTAAVERAGSSRFMRLVVSH